MNSRELAYIGGILILAVTCFYFGYVVAQNPAQSNQAMIAPSPQTSSPTPTRTVTPIPSLDPGQFEDNPERIENDDNPGESNRRGRDRNKD